MAKRQLVVFRVGVGEFAIDIMHAKEIVVLREVSRVPGTEDFVEGVMNLRGSLVPVLDLRKRLRARPAEAHGDERVMVVRLEERLLGLIVDGASEVVRAGEEAIGPPPDIIVESGIDYIEGVVSAGGRFIALIDLVKALGGDVLWELERVAGALEACREPEATAGAI